jgi:3-(3-hydroxy-phenyl)propionate hydroxylase
VQLGPDNHLLDHVDHQLTLLYFTADAALPEALQAEVTAWRARGFPLRVLAISAHDTTPVAGADATLPDATGRVRLRYGVRTGGAAYLLRPDQHVCARWMALDATRLHAALKTVTGQSTPGAHA